MNILKLLAVTTFLMVFSMSSYAAQRIADSSGYVKPGCTKHILHHGYGVKVTGFKCGGNTFVGIVQDSYNSRWVSLASGYTGKVWSVGSWTLFKN